MVIEDESTGLAMYRTGQLDCGPMQWWVVRQPDLEALQQSHPHLRYQDFQAIGGSMLALRTDQPPFNDVRVRRAISMAIDRQALVTAIAIRGQPTPAIAPGLTAWSLPLDQLDAGAQYYQYNPHEARRLLADAGFANGLKTPLAATGGIGMDHLNAVGKSRLVEVLREHGISQGATRLVFRCSAYHQQSAVFPVIDHLQRFLHWDSKARSCWASSRTLS